jgi:hypothetical protein
MQCTAELREMQRPFFTTECIFTAKQKIKKRGHKFEFRKLFRIRQHEKNYRQNYGRCNRSV